ncbi:STAS/SEC14 domain-containing protein [Polyangium sp. 6x1]|uniref:STAS/SEC14 domain-containing protein n=1 Tax=Polyangium sp. 6x1 TaxID=3042689 RepID=UPI002482AFDC|nr:STAS/SEC14 domain-containing protein [Polyangium sp. 6x1]MDI1446411.1 STAS/SEC14 domain-containing protein [Polyangium sp. 6x1]
MDDTWQHVGAHQNRFEPPDLLHTRAVGPISRDEFAAAFDEIELRAREGPVFWLVDLTHLDGIAPEARRLLSERDARALLRGIVLIGGSFPQRVLATLALKAVRLFWRHETHVPFAFLTDEREARAWIEAERRAHPSPHASAGAAAGKEL